MSRAKDFAFALQKMSHSSRKGKLLMQNLPEKSDSIDIKQSGTSITRKFLAFAKGGEKKSIRALTASCVEFRYLLLQRASE